MSEGSKIEVVGRLLRADGTCDREVALGALDFSGWGEMQVVPAAGRVLGIRADEAVTARARSTRL